jgi:phosphoribosylamine--glycine ligase
MREGNVLVVGSGGREHALVWKLGQSRRVGTVFCAPGNGGTPNNVAIDVADFEGLAEFALKNNCFTVVGPEEPLAKGITDTFLSKRLNIFGVTKTAARVESSKIWAKQFMKRYGIATAQFEIFDETAAAIDNVKKRGTPFVVKADGLAAGKGVIVCNTENDALKAIDEMMRQKKFGSSGERIVIEDFLAGEEASYIALVDTKARKHVALASSQDHKAIFDGDKGPNTGGMGAYSPAPVITEELEERIQTDIITKFIDGMRNENVEFRGTLFLGLMIANEKLKVLEFNVRFGDPELQPIVVRMKSDLLEYLDACASGRLAEMENMKWSDQAAVCVVMASEGYPGQYQKGKVIKGIEETPRIKNAVVFHAGTTRQGSNLITSGGRVLGVTALGDTIPNAINEAYRTVGLIHWEGEYHRTDIGRKALKHLHAAKENV